MTKTLFVQYTPRYEHSATLELQKHFQTRAEGDQVVEDIATSPPTLLLPHNLPHYFKRDYMGQKLEAHEAKALEEFDGYIQQLKNADVLVLAYPMYNFSQPAAVKAWFDAVLLKGHTWNFNDKGYVGLLKGKKALLITTSGGQYEAGSPMEHSMSLTKSLFQFMGFDEIEIVSAQGVNKTPQDKEKIMGEAKAKLDAIAKRWYA